MRKILLSSAIVLSLVGGASAMPATKAAPAAKHLGRVQERIVRLEASRTTPGSGLGLALVAACAKLHGGRLVLGDNRPGLLAALELSDQRS